MLRKGEIVSNSNRGGKWKIIAKENSNPRFSECARYTLINANTKEILVGVRDKDVISRKHPLFEQFITL